MKSSQKAARHKSNKSNYKLIVACLLGALIVYVLGYYAVQYVSMQRETDSFFKLKSDFQNLQVEFNKVDKGWEYGEGCVGRGGVFEGDVPNSCSLSNSLSGVPLTLANQKLEQYKDIIVAAGHFSATRKNEHLYSLSSNDLPSATCAIQYGTANDPTYISFTCRVPARQFYFPRTDR